jgi:hypothetical protein
MLPFFIAVGSTSQPGRYPPANKQVMEGCQRIEAQIILKAVAPVRGQFQQG